MMLIAGVDDAGRGAVIGPLVIAGVTLHDHQISQLEEIGVKDSKALKPKRRLMLSQAIERLAFKWEVIEVSPVEVDKVVLEGRKLRRLNWFEAVTMAEVIKKLRPDIAFVDASDVDEMRFARQLKERLPFNVKIVSEHHADTKYTVVGAASIIAKVYRDKVIALLHKQYGNFGSGYSSDPKTRQFLLEWIKEKKNIPSFVRKSWKTIKHLTEKE